MANLDPVATALLTVGDRGVQIVNWTPIISSSTPTAFQCPGYNDRSVQITGTWDGATIKIQGSNDGVTYLDLTDPQGNAISKTANAIEAIEELTRFIKPVLSAANTNTSLTVSLLVRKQG